MKTAEPPVVEDLFDLDLRIVPGQEPVGVAKTDFTACNQFTCNFSCTFTCTGATGRPCAC
jgi:hypothetical protein